MGIQLQIETTNVCQADCVFCSYTKMTRPKGTMPLELFRRIVDDALTVPLIEQITLTGLGETLLDRFLIERLRYIKAQTPALPVDLYTNGNLLTPAKTDALIAAGLDVLYVSLNAMTAEKRREVMALDDFDQVLGYCDYALAATKGTRTKVIIKGVASKDLMEVGEHDAFLQRWGGDHTTGGAAYLHLEGNWAGAMGQRMRTTPRSACHRAFGQIMVLWDGRVSLCCFDGFGEVILGDLRTQTIREVYNGERALGYRLAHQEGRRAELPLCGTCTAI